MPVRSSQSRLCLLIACVVVLFGLAATPAFAQQPEEEQQREREREQTQETPLRFAQRTDVGDEIQLSDEQLDMTEQLTEESDQISQQLFEQFFQSLSVAVSQHLLLAGPEAQRQVYDELRRDVEIAMLDQRVLSDTQMNRFSQLWGQRQGLDALVSGRSSDQLNISPNQRNQIQQIRNDGNQLIGQCLQIPESGGQRNQIINSIQSIVFNQSISVLDNAQIEQLIVNLGEPFQFADGGGTGTGIGAGTEAVAGTEAGDSFSSENGAIAASPSSGEGQEDGNGVGR